MALLVIRQAKNVLALPHKILINGRLLGIMRTPEVNIQLPAGNYEVEIQSMISFIKSTRTITVDENRATLLTFCDKEKWWDIVFWGDMVLWLAKLFLHIPKPYSTIYEVVSDVVFAIWLWHEWRIRNDYFAVNLEKTEIRRQ